MMNDPSKDDPAVMQRARERDAKMLEELGLSPDSSTPPNYYREQRRPEYPSIGDQLDALHKARNGDTSELEAIDSVISDIKVKYPKEN
jgi:hypothetical protein